MPLLTPAQIVSALQRLEGLHSMLTLNQAIEILTGKKPSLRRRIRERARNIWSDVRYAATAPIRKTVDAIDGEPMFAESDLELFLRRCRKTGFIEDFGMEIAYYEIPLEGLRIIAADLRAALKGEPPLRFPDCIAELRRGLPSSQSETS